MVTKKTSSLLIRSALFPVVPQDRLISRYTFYSNPIILNTIVLSYPCDIDCDKIWFILLLSLDVNTLCYFLDRSIASIWSLFSTFWSRQIRLRLELRWRSYISNIKTSKNKEKMWVIIYSTVVYMFGRWRTQSIIIADL